MKKLLCILFAVLLVTGCGREAPARYSYYENFVPVALGEKITAVETAGYSDITESENTALLRQKLGLENLNSHSVYTTKSAAVANFYFDQYTDHSQMEKALEYGYETFWLGKMHTADLLPYEDWQYSHRTKQLTVQVFCEDVAVFQQTYGFDKLTDSGEKLYEKTGAVDNDVLIPGTYIYLGDWLKGSDEQLAQYVNIDSLADMAVHTSLRQTADKEKLIVELLTEERQIAPQKLNSIYDAVVERYSFINRNILIRLYVADEGMYFEYDGYVQLPQEQ